MEPIYPSYTCPISTTKENGGGEPELQKMAAFLRERCDKGMYGLRYLNQERTLIQIPWPNAPRSNEKIPESFQMFKEWADLSFRKRGNRCEHLENEALSAQKHRFRNALARADGLRAYKEQAEGCKIFEFADTKKDREGNHYNHMRGAGSPSTYYSTVSNTNCTYSPSQHSDRLSDSCSTTDWEQQLVPSPNNNIVHSPGHAIVGNYHPMNCQVTVNQNQPDIPISDEPVTSLTALLEAIDLPLDEDGLVDIDQNQFGYQYTANALSQTIEMNAQETQILTDHQSSIHRYNHATRSINPYMSIPVPGHLSAVIMYRGEPVISHSITNSYGFRLYSGNNVPDMSRLLDMEQRRQLSQITRFNSHDLFGPDSIEQVQLPMPQNVSNSTDMRTVQILSNMDRGLIFYLNYPAPDTTNNICSLIPDVYSMRLCQTRVFPYETNVYESEYLEKEGLQRKGWVKIFDANNFIAQAEQWQNKRGRLPLAKIKMSVGQKPKKPEENLVSITVTVLTAQGIIGRMEGDIVEDICISDKNSMDVAAQLIRDQIKSRIQLDDDGYPV